MEEKSFKKFLFGVVLKTKETCWDLFKIMIPLIFLIKVIQELDLLKYFVYPFEFIMGAVGIPDIYALAWLGAIFNTCYMAMTLIAVFFNDYPLTVEQISVLGLMILISHSLIIEGAIISKFKVSGIYSIVLRVVCSLFFGYLLHITAQYFGIMQQRATSIFYGNVEMYHHTFLELYFAGNLAAEFHTWLINVLWWFYAQAKTIVLITFVIFMLFVLIQLMKDFNVVQKIDKIFKPFWSIMGISKRNYTVTSICYLIGLSYGYGILKEESEKSISFRKDQPFKVLSFLAIVHAVIEDGIIFMLLGASGWVVIVGRTLIGILVVWLLVRFIMPRLSERTKNKFLYKGA
ncbi:MAG: hypothetical protein LBQ34_01180 [Alphaproteobacteria bacterium]|jgi:hypothetical protein|nr:hypothetical protein [Alphaproteobacteria bacterium]